MFAFNEYNGPSGIKPNHFIWTLLTKFVECITMSYAEMKTHGDTFKQNNQMAVTPSLLTIPGHDNYIRMST